MPNNCVHSGKIFPEHERTYVRLLGRQEYYLKCRCKKGFFKSRKNLMLLNFLAPKKKNPRFETLKIAFESESKYCKCAAIAN